LTKGRVWNGDPALKLIEDALKRERLVLIAGGQGTGKTVVTRTTVYQLVAANALPVYWDFEHLGPKLPVPPSEFWNGAITYALVNSCEPLVVLENVHLNREQFQELLGLRDISGVAGQTVQLIATSRVAELGLGKRTARLQAATVSLEKESLERGEKLLWWWMKDVLKLDEETARQIRRAVPWNRYLNDFWLLRLALESLDVQRRTLPMWAIEDSLRKRVDPTISGYPGADDLLYLISGLGRAGIATEMEAAARCLKQSLPEIKKLAEQASHDGLISIDSERRTCRIWHESLAEVYWAVFMLQGELWAKRARDVLRGVV
jgi:hypothetical protein